MNYRRGRGARAAIVALCAMLAGCQDDSGGATVQGIISAKGKPLGEGTVSFVPKGMPVAWSRIEPDGSYKLLNSRKKERIEPGTYSVVIIAGQRDLTGETPGPVEELPVPVSVTNQATTPLTYDVKPGPNSIDINLDEIDQQKSKSKNGR